MQKLREENAILRKNSESNLRLVDKIFTEIQQVSSIKLYSTLKWCSSVIRNGYFKQENSQIAYGNIETLRMDRYKKTLLKKHQYKEPIIFPPTIEWNVPLKQRPQHLAKALADNGYTYFYCTNNQYDNVIGYKKMSKNLFLTNQFPALLESLCRGWIIFHAAHPGYTMNDLKNWKNLGYKILYEYVDELDPTIMRSPNYHLIVERHREINEHTVNLIVVTAKRLLKEMQDRVPLNKVVYLPNGVEYKHFSSRKRKSLVDMKPIVDQGKPIIGYYGALASWIDYDLLEYVAEMKPEWNIVLIGWNFDNTINRVLQKKNIHYLGIKNYNELPHYLQLFDVAMIPFIRGNIAKSTSPLKLFEYMSAQKQIVVTRDMFECIGYDGVYVADNKEDFLYKLGVALRRKNSSRIKSRLAIQGKENCWKNRANKLGKIMEKIRNELTTNQRLSIENESLKLRITRQGNEIYFLENTKIYRVIKKFESVIKSLKRVLFSLTIICIIV